MSNRSQSHQIVPVTRRDLILKGSAAAAVASTAVVIMPQPAHAFIGAILRFFFRAFVRGFRVAGRNVSRVARIGRSTAVRSQYGASRISAVDLADGFMTINDISQLTHYDRQIVGVREEVAQQIIKHNASDFWFLDEINKFRMSFLNDTGRDEIYNPVIFLEEENLETGSMETRPRPILFTRPWRVAEVGHIPALNAPDSKLLRRRPIVPGPFEIRPYMENEPDVVFDPIRVQIVKRGDIQFRT